MKINEILVEAGFLSKLGQGIKAGVAGYKQSQALRKNTEELSQATDDALKSYNKFLANYTASGKTINPTVVSTWMAQYLGTKPKGKPANVGIEEIRSWVNRELGSYFSAKQLGTTPGTKTTAKQKSKTPPAQPTQISGFEVIVQDPIMIRYNKNDYVLDQNGEWVPMSAKGTKKPLVKDYNPTLEKLLDRVAGTEKQSTPVTPKQPIKIIASVTIPNGTRADKWSDGKWSVPENGENVEVADSDIAPLDNLLKQQQEQPAVFKSNRRA